MKSFYLLLFVLLTASCSGYTVSDDATEDKKSYPVVIGVRSGTKPLSEDHYPISVYIFNSEGELAEKHLIENPEASFSAKLGEGDYKISAFSGLDSEVYSFPEFPTTGSKIEMKDNNIALKSPLMSGFSSISVSKATDVKISMSYVVASLKMAISNIPKDAEKVSLSVSPVSKSYSFSGTYAGSEEKATIDCIKSDALWSSSVFYVLPSESASTVLSISISRKGSDENYSYTYRGKLEPARPYTFTGEYNEGFAINGSFEVVGWKPGIDIEFEFNEPGNGNSGSNSDNEGEIDVVYSSVLPSSNSFWKEFYVWKVTAISTTEVEAIIIGPRQWPEVHYSDIDFYLSGYEEGGLTDWRTFTKDEAKAMHGEFSSNMGDLNYNLSNNGHNRFYYNDGERYLCENGKYTFKFGGAFKASQSGEKTLYYLRPVKTVRIVLK